MPAWQGWAAALLTLDTGANLSDASDRTGLSTLGSAMLACLLRMPKARACAAQPLALRSPWEPLSGTMSTLLLRC